MRPDALFPLFAPLGSLPGIGERLAGLYAKLGLTKVLDLCFDLPSNVIDRSYSPRLDGAEPGRVVTLTMRVEAHEAPASSRLPHRVRLLAPEGGDGLDLVYFHAKGDYLERLLPLGATRVVSGRLESYRGRWQISHPDFVVPPEEAATLPRFEAVYPLTAGLGQKQRHKAVAAALTRCPELPEWLDAALMAREGWQPWRDAILEAHAPRSIADLARRAPPRARLAYDELLAGQLALNLMRLRQKARKGRALVGDGSLTTRLRASLPFEPTGSQEAAIADIAADMAKPERMLRLLQGDVGSGKTLVALFAMLSAVEAGHQAALMAPTEILARQHFETLVSLVADLDLTPVMLTGRARQKGRKEALARIADGRARLVIGTHALFQDEVAFRELGLAVIDEQHRFGVHQRLLLADKGAGADVLVMTATPIPRTLVLAAYGDMDVSLLTEKPARRQPIKTAKVSLDRFDEVVERLGRALAGGRKAYWICPLVETSEASDLAAAEHRHAMLKARFGDGVVLIHGRMKSAEKDAAMSAFAEGDGRLLVATTVVEVGVDVPSATIMVIEHAERFGLAQLHQLRGRIGRGSEASACLLLHSMPLGETARRRLQTMVETEDGFRIAEEDLKLRGAGELLGTRQSGLPQLRLADYESQGDLLAIARDDARLIVETDPELASARGTALKTLLYLFEQDQAIRFLRSG